MEKPTVTAKRALKELHAQKPAILKDSELDDPPDDEIDDPLDGKKDSESKKKSGGTYRWRRAT